MFMKNQLLVLGLAAGIFCLSGCRNDAIEEVVSFSVGEPTRTEFTFQAGLGSISLQASGSLAVTAESSAPEWCRVAVYDNSSVVYNVDTNRSDESRSATITVSADGFPSETFDISQGPLEGLLVNPTELTFSDEVTEISIEVIAACDYEVEWTENEDEVFTVKKSEDGSVLTFNSPLPGIYSKKGQVNLVPKLAEGVTLDGDGIVGISLDLPRMGTYKLLLGEWELVSDKRAEGVSPTKFTFEEKVYGESYNVYLEGIEKVEDEFPITITLEDGMALIRAGQQLGIADNYYYSAHFNYIGTNGTTYFGLTFDSDIYWAAEPELDDEARTVTLTFEDKGQAHGNKVDIWKFYASAGGYWGWTRCLYATKAPLVISKSYPNTDPDAGGDTGSDTGGTDN